MADFKEPDDSDALSERDRRFLENWEGKDKEAAEESEAEYQEYLEAGSDDDPAENGGDDDEDEEKAEEVEVEAPENDPRCNGNCQESDDDWAEQCPYCNRNNGELVCFDYHNDPVYHGAAVEIIERKHGFSLGRARVYNESDPHGKKTWPCVVQEGWENGDHKHAWKGKPAWTFEKVQGDKLRQFDWIERLPPDDQNYQEGELPDINLDDFIDDEDDSMTDEQEDRFKGLSDDLMDYVGEILFGKKAETKTIGEIEDGIFYGEDLNQTIEIESGGVIWRVTLSAERADEEED